MYYYLLFYLKVSNYLKKIDSQLSIKKIKGEFAYTKEFR